MITDREKKKTIPPQDIQAKKAESQRLFAGDRLLEPAGRADILRRADLTREDLRSFEDRVVFSPFLEIGAGTGVRGLRLSQDYGAQGVITDISLNSLRCMPYAALILNTSHFPQRICCDSHHLPYSDNSFNFVFAYRTLHHSTNPVPLTAECYRVLGKGGHFFFNEEPLTSPLRTFLRGKRQLSPQGTTVQNLAKRFGLEKVFWDDGCLERSAGIEEQRFERWLWLSALAPFEQVELTINSRLRLKTDLRRPKLLAWLAGWVGGNVRGFCQKQSGEPMEGRVEDHLMCVDCRSTLLSSAPDLSLDCGTCGRKYPVFDGVVRILPLEIERAIHGEGCEQPE